MKTTRVARFLAVTIVAGLLAAPFATAQKDEQAEVLMQAAHQKQLVEGELEEAFAPMSVTVCLEDEVDVSRGDMLALAGNLPHSSRRFAGYWRDWLGRAGRRST